MTILVTGATGLVGNNVVRQFVDAHPEQHIRCLVRPGADPRPLTGLPVEAIAGDIEDLDSVERACADVSAVVHCAALVHIGWSLHKEMLAVNVAGTQNVARAARAVDARLIHISSTDTFRQGADRHIPYVATKIAAEEMVRAEIEHGLEAIIINPAFLLGPNDWKPSSGRALLAAATRWVPFAPRGNLNLCDARDVSSAIVHAVKAGVSGKQYSLGGHNLRWLDALRSFASYGGQWPSICRFDPVADRAVGLGADMIGKLAGGELAVNSAVMRLARTTLEVDDNLARNELDYVNRPLDETLRDTWQWFRDCELTK